MIIKPLSLLAMAMLSLSAYAETGTITFQGEIVNNACDSTYQSSDKRCSEFLKTTGMQQFGNEQGYQSLSEVQQAIKNGHHPIAAIEVRAVETDTQAGNIVVSYR